MRKASTCKRENERGKHKIFGCVVCDRLCGGSGHPAGPIFPDGICCDTCKENLRVPAAQDECFKASGAESATRIL
jgi:hypothetical protein